MQYRDVRKAARRRLMKTLTIAAAGATAAAIALPGPSALADPVPPAPAPAPAPAPDAGAPAAPAPASAPAPDAGAPAAPAPAPAPGAPAPAPDAPPAGAPAPPPADPNAPPPDPNAPPAPPAPPAPAPAPPEPGRVNNDAGGFSYIVPQGWKISDATQLSYGQALLTKVAAPGEQPPTDTSVLIGRLDLKLFAGAEADNGKAANRLASDMGEFFMPFAGTRINQAAAQLTAGTMPGAASFYEVKFTDTSKPNGQIWAGVVGNPPPDSSIRAQRNPQRWFVVWLGSSNHPVDKDAAAALAQSIRPWNPPPPPAPDPNAPAPAPAPADPAHPMVGVPVPVTNAPPEMSPQQ